MPLPERGDAARRTTFSSLSATGVVEDALLTNRDLNGRLDFMTIDGSGTVNLLDDAIDFDLVATMVDGPVLQSDPEMVEVRGQEAAADGDGHRRRAVGAAGFRARSCAQQIVERRESNERVDERARRSAGASPRPPARPARAVRADARAIVPRSARSA